MKVVFEAIIILIFRDWTANISIDWLHVYMFMYNLPTIAKCLSRTTFTLIKSPISEYKWSNDQNGYTDRERGQKDGVEMEVSSH